MAKECLTEDLLVRLLAANSPKDYLDQEDIADRKLPDYLFELLDEKGVKRADVVRASGLHPTVVYDIFAGKSLPGRDNAIMLAFAPRMRATRRCCTMRAWCPCIVREIIERACAFEPSARYQTVVQLGAAVDAVRRGVREPSDANSFSAAGDGARGSRSDGWRGGGASGSSQQARHFASSGPTDSANAQAPGGSPFRQAASSQGQTSGHDATCGPGLPLLAPPTRRGARERRRVLSPVSRGWSVFWASCSACSSLRSFLLWDGATAGGEAKTIRPLPTRICTRSSTLNRVSLIRKQSRTTLA